jgi:hypothetical protein
MAASPQSPLDAPTAASPVITAKPNDVDLDLTDAALASQVSVPETRPSRRQRVTRKYGQSQGKLVAKDAAVEISPLATPSTITEVRTVPLVLPSILWCVAMLLAANAGTFPFVLFCFVTSAFAISQRLVTLNAHPPRNPVDWLSANVAALYTLCAVSLSVIAINRGVAWAVVVLGMGMAFDVSQKVFIDSNANRWDAPLATGLTLFAAALVVGAVITNFDWHAPWLCAIAIGVTAPMSRKLLRWLQVSSRARLSSHRFDSLLIAAPLCTLILFVLR